MAASSKVGERDSIGGSRSKRRSWTSSSFREVWTAPPDAFMNNNTDSARWHSNLQRDDDDELELKFAALERLPTYERVRKGVLRQVNDDGKVVHDEVDVTKLGLHQKKILIDMILNAVEQDNEKFLCKLRQRVDRVGIEIPKIEVRYGNLTVVGDVYVGSRALPTFVKFYSKRFREYSGIVSP